MSDNELDNLFKEAAEEFKAPQDQSAWQDMASKLDQAGATTASFWNWKSISTMAVVGVVSVGVILYLMTSETDIPKTKEITSNQFVGVEGVTQEKPVENIVAETNSTSSLPAKGVVDASSNKASDTQAATVAKENLNNSIPEATIDHAQNSHESKKVEQHRNESKDAARSTNEEISSLAPVEVSALATQASGSSLESNNSQSQPPVVENEITRGDKNIQVMNDSLIKESDDTKEIKIESALADEEKATPDPDSDREKRKKFIPTIGLKLAVAPDYTSVQSSTPNHLGVGYGILVEYQFSDHWSIATGGIWTKKIYTAYDVEYNGYNADWVDGDCRMWDIPVNIYYKFNPGRSFSFYAGFGFSSYLMNEENYVYYIETPNGVYDYPKQIQGENNEWFKTANISLGMQLKMNKILTLQFEPILKAPLAGVGEGEVSLVSLGAFFNLRFDIPIKKQE